MKQIKLTKGKVALVDDDDFTKLANYNWTARQRYDDLWYAYRKEKVGDKWSMVYMHRQILGLTDPKVIVDHKNHDGLNNQKSNIRICDRSKNGMNRRSAKTSTSRFIGVSFYKKYGKWLAQIQKEGKSQNIGYFNTEEQAAEAYKVRAKEVFGEFAYQGN